MNAAESYSIILFIEGVKIPCQAANITIGEHGANANIAVYSDPSLARILPRTRINLFCERASDGSNFLIFEGEVHGVSSSSTGSTRTMRLICNDIPSYLSYMYKFFLKEYNVFQIDQREIAHFGAAIGNPEIVIKNGGNNKARSAIAEPDNIMDIVYRLIDEVLEVNQFFQSLEKDVGFKNRFYSIPDEVVDTIFDHEIAKKIINKSPMKDMMTLKQTFARILGMVFYDQSILSSIAYVNGEFRQVIHKPDNFMIPPPLCNVVLPGQVGSVSFSRNMLAEPTRLGLRSSTGMLSTPSGSESMRYVAYAPEELESITNKQVLHKELIPGEEITGIIPLYIDNNSANEMVGIKFDNDKNPTSDKHTTSMVYSAQHKLRESQLAASSVQASSMVFSPQLACNFNGAVFGADFLYTGIIKTIRHSLGQNGFSTSMNMSHCRQMEKDLITIPYYDKIDFDWDNPEMTSDQKIKASLTDDFQFSYPPIVSDKFKPSQIDDTYMDLLGCESVMPGFDANEASVTDSIREINEEYKRYSGGGKGYEYAVAITNRSMITLPQFEDFFGLIWDGFKYKADGYFKEAKQDVIIEYLKKIKQNRSG